MSTKIRSSQQLAIDANLNVNNNKIVNLTAGVALSDGVNVEQLNTAIGDATTGLGNSIHTPVADLAGAKAIISTDRADKMIMNIEALGLYRFNTEGVEISDDNTYIRPTDVASDASPGRWVKISSTITDHDLLSNIKGGSTGQRNHLSDAQVLALHAAETATTIGAIVNGAADATPNDTDIVATVQAGVVRKITWTNVKAFLKIYFDTLYNKYVHPNHTGDVDSVADGAVTIKGKAVTLAKMADVATATFIGRTTAGPGVPEAMTVAQAKVLLGLTTLNLAQRKYRVTPSGTINGSNLIFTIADNVIPGTEEVFKNGVLQTAIVNYTISYGATTTITYVATYVPSNVGYNDIISVNYSI